MQKQTKTTLFPSDFVLSTTLRSVSWPALNLFTMCFIDTSQICSQNIMWCKPCAPQTLTTQPTTTPNPAISNSEIVRLNSSVTKPLRLPLVVFLLSFDGNLCWFFGFRLVLILGKQGCSYQGCSAWDAGWRWAVTSLGYHWRAAFSLSSIVRCTKNEHVSSWVPVGAVKITKQTAKYRDDTVYGVWGTCFTQITDCWLSSRWLL